MPEIRDKAFYDQIYLIKFHCLLYCQSHQRLPKETKHCTFTTRFSQILTTSPNPWNSQGPFPSALQHINNGRTQTPALRRPEPLGSRSTSVTSVCVCHVCAFTNPTSWWYRTNNSAANPERKQNMLLWGLEGGQVSCTGEAPEPGRRGSASVPSTRTMCTPGPCWQCSNVLSLMVTEIRSLPGTQARLALPRVLGGNQALTDLYLSSAFRILSL